MTIDKMHIFRSETSLLFHLNIKSELDKIPVHHHYYHCHSLLITIVKLLKLPYLMSDDLCLFLKLSHPLSHLTNINRTWCNPMHLLWLCNYHASLHQRISLQRWFYIVTVLLSDEDISNRLWHRRISHVWGRSPLVSQAQSSSPLLSYIIKSIMFMDLLWEVYTSSQHGSGSWI